MQQTESARAPADPVPGWSRVLVCSWLFWGLLTGMGAEALYGPIRGGFSVAEADRETGDRRFFLRGESATPLSSEEWLIEGPRLETYEGGTVTNLVIESLRSSFHQKEQRVRSPERLRVATGDGGLSIEGVGFGLDLVSGRLVVSNQVQAMIRKEVLDTDKRRGGSAVGSGTILVRSERLEFEGEEALFLGQVEVEEEEGSIRCERLLVELSLETRQAGRISAWGDVRLESETADAWAEHVVYDPLTDRLELDGSPRWRGQGRAGRADRILVDRAGRRVEALGEVEMETVAGALMPGGRWPGHPMEAETEDARRLVRVRSDEFRLGPVESGEDRSVAVFRGGVVVNEETARLTCDELTVELQGSGEEASRAVASGNVVLEREDQRVTCGWADYDAKRGMVRLEGGTTWRTEGREGRSDRFELDLERGQYRGEGDVVMRMAGEELAGAIDFLAMENPEPGRTAGPEEATLRVVEIRSDRFEYRSERDEDETGTAVYEGNVVVRDGDQFVMESRRLVAQVRGGSHALEQLTADGDVEMRMTEEDGYRLGRGDRLMYRADEGLVELTGVEQVEFYVVTGAGVSRGMGRRAVYDVRTQMLQLEGRPVITTPDGDLRGDVVRMDRAHGTLSASGSWRIRVPLDTHRIPEWRAP